MSISIEALKTKFDSLLQTISKHINGKLGREEAAVSAAKLTNPFTLSLSNDAIATANVDGAQAVNLSVILKTVMASPGTYTKVTVDAKGRVVAAEAMIASDIPNLDASKITTGVFAVARIPILNQNTNGNAATATKLATPRQIAVSGDATGTVAFDGSGDVSVPLSLKNSGVTPGTYGGATQIPQVTVDNKGRVTGVTLIDIKAQTAMAVNEYITVAAGGVKSYDLQTLLGPDHVAFDKKTAEICVRVKDINGSSPLYNAYANAEALVSYGIKDERTVIIANQHTAPVDLYVKVLVHPL